ncbi:TolA-binding protein [Paracoccus isoporae]|uniref:TolA-binding protein n=1 Tax=Paracoccus isoporae TaxID=591205 RepID=A0A1G6YR93_9RHOB|nr:tetratricopeptide repeat protein [Paracoccus isoporae]SDD92929.1 TolA-binding protein [Paracoccus isoporae]
MRGARLSLLFLVCGAALPAAGQDIAPMGGAIALDDPALVEGLEALPQQGSEAVEQDPVSAGAAAEMDPDTLADMQADLRTISADLQGLRAELLASGAQGFAAAGGDSAIDRMNAMESRIADLTARTEKLSNTIRRVVAETGNRIGDLEFRLCELDPNCDLGALMSEQLGSGAAAPPGAPPASAPPSDISAVVLPPPADTPVDIAPPTEEEHREFAAARRAVEAGRWQEAMTQLDHLVSAHAGGPLTADSLYLLGLAQNAGEMPEAAAKSWLMAFSAAPDGARAAASLLALSEVLGEMGEPGDACPFLEELRRRFPDSAEAAAGTEHPAAAACADQAAPEGDGAD